MPNKDEQDQLTDILGNNQDIVRSDVDRAPYFFVLPVFSTRLSYVLYRLAESRDNGRSNG
jgi:hypothetical protein